MMVSIITPTYNRAKMLSKCLNSLLNQTYRDIEIIIVDDGSTDGTNEVVRKFNDDRIIYINEGKIGNISKLRNKGIQLSKGDFIAFCDDDDIWLKNKLEVQMNYMEKEKMVCSNGNGIDNNDEIFIDKINDFKEDKYIDLYQLLREDDIITSSVLVRKDVVLEAGMFNESEGNRSEDYFLWMKIATKQKIKYINQVLMSYRSHGDNLCARSYEDIRELMTRNIDIIEHYLKDDDPVIVKSSRYGLSLIYSRLAKLSYLNGDISDSHKYCKNFIFYSTNKLTLKFLKYLLFYFYISVIKVFK